MPASEALVDAILAFVEDVGLEPGRDRLFELLTSDASGEMITVAAQELLIADGYGRLQTEQERGRALAEYSALPPEEAIEFFRRKRLMSPEAFKRLEDAHKMHAFAVAGLHQRFAIHQAHALLSDAIAEGVSQQTAIKTLRQQADRWGLTGSSPHHLEVVFRNNVLGAYAGGRWQQLQQVKARRPYWQYMTAGDNRVRDTHREMHRKVYPADHPVWRSWFPPNGHNCRCTVVSLSQAELEREGLDPDQPPPEAEPDKGWRASPAGAKKSDPEVKRLRGWVRRSGLLQPPELATKGTAPHTTAGDLGRSAHRRAARVDDWASMSAEAVRRHAGRMARRQQPLRRLPRGASEVQVPIPSQYLDSAEQWIERAAGPDTAGLLESLQMRGQATYDSRKAAARRAEAVVADGVTRTTEVVLSLLGRGPQDARALAELGRMAQAGEGAIRRSPQVADVVLRGVDRAEGYAPARLNSRKIDGRHELRLSRDPLDGWKSERVLVTQERAEELQ